MGNGHCTCSYCCVTFHEKYSGRCNCCNCHANLVRKRDPNNVICQWCGIRTGSRKFCRSCRAKKNYNKGIRD